MTDLVVALLVVALLAVIVLFVSLRFPQSLRRLIWLGFFEYLLCTVAQLVYSRVIVGGGDMLLYTTMGKNLALTMERNFAWAAPEVLRLLVQQPSAFDDLVYGGGGGNTASMQALCAFLLYGLNGSDYAVHVCFAGGAFLGALGLCSTFCELQPNCPPRHLLIATVLFPSIAFWTCAPHKESVCLAGLGALLVGWRALLRFRLVRALIFGSLGLVLMVIFRIHILVPVLSGLGAFFVVDRLTRARGVDRVILTPAYFVAAAVLMAIAMVAITRIAPRLAIDKLGETVAVQQGNWALSRGGSSINVGAEDGGPQSLGGQLVRVPLALVNSLLRPQFFDVNNIGSALSAIEMTTITVLLFRALRARGIGGLVTGIQRSPFLLMCAVVTVIGCTFVGLVTFNFGSLARYRVPLLPFYGALVVCLQRPMLARSRPARARSREWPGGRSRLPAAH